MSNQRSRGAEAATEVDLIEASGGGDPRALLVPARAVTRRQCDGDQKIAHETLSDEKKSGVNIRPCERGSVAGGRRSVGARRRAAPSRAGFADTHFG